MHWHFVYPALETPATAAPPAEQPSEWERSSKTAFRSTPANSGGHLPSVRLWKPNSIHTLPSCPYAVAVSSLLPNQALCRFYQHPLKESPTMDIASFLFMASSTLCSPNALDCKNECRMGSLRDNPRFHMLGASWYLSDAKTDGASQEPHCETKAEPWAATNMCQDPGNSIIDRFDRTHREVILTVAPCQLPPKECHFRMVLSQGSFPLLPVLVTELPTVGMTQTHSLSSSRD